MQFVVAFAITFSSVFLKGLQHKNVQHDMYSSIFFTSFFMASLDFAIIKFIADTTTWTMALFCGGGGAFGMITSVWIHKRLLARRMRNAEIDTRERSPERA